MIGDEVIQLTSTDAFIISLKFHFDFFKASIFRSEKPWGEGVIDSRGLMYRSGGVYSSVFPWQCFLFLFLKSSSFFFHIA